jgi:murein DD-endopeptidase MepM/ murein hydrolase activator NlpD
MFMKLTHIINITTFSLLLTSCALFKKPIPLPKYETIDQVIYPGKVQKMSLKLSKMGTNHKLICDQKEVNSIIAGDRLEAFYSVNYKHLLRGQKKSIPCYLQSTIDGENVSFHVFNLRVEEWDYPKSYIKVAKKHVDLAQKDIDRFLKEKAELTKVYANIKKGEKLFTSDFQAPLKSKVTGVYGSRRVFNNKKDSWHSGTDFRARRPTPIPSSNSGVVVHAKHLFFNGKAVFIDHGMGIMTMYCHLSKINVKTGDRVEKGQIIGLSGNTGRSSAPHLHWGVRIQNNWIDGLQFLKAQKGSALESNYQSTSSQK